MKEKSRLLFRIGFILFILSPLPFITSLLAFDYHATRILGRSPSYDNPDPKNLHIYNSYEPVISVSAEYWLFSLLAFIPFIIIYSVINRKNPKWSWLLPSVLTNLFGIMIFTSSIMEWFID